MAEIEMPPGGELHPHLLYRQDGGQARFATWELSDGHEALALFATADSAATYRDELLEPAAWTAYEPPRAQLIEIFLACRASGILYAALDPLGGQAKTLFDIPQVLAAAQGGEPTAGDERST
jgi:hypothetical protein